MHLSIVQARYLTNCDKCQKLGNVYRATYDLCVKHCQNVMPVEVKNLDI